ncbi:MAG: TIGR02587 family membrane protein [Salinimicrobium sp.]
MGKRPNSKTLKQYGRGIVGGLLFSLPLLFTMELWWHGFIISPAKLIAFVIFTLLLLMGYNRYAGLREDATFYEVLHESIEDIALALLVAFLILLLINKIDFQMPLQELAGKVIIESLVVAIGISVGTSQMGQKQNGQDSQDQKKDKKSRSHNENSQEQGSKQADPEEAQNSLFQRSILSVCGAVLISSSMAPTGEIEKIAVVSTAVHLLLMVLFSFLLSLIVLYFSDFKNSSAPKNGWREILSHVMLGYMMALLISFILLWFFGRIGGHGYNLMIAEIIVLAVPGSLGASAGRLLIG